MYKIEKNIKPPVKKKYPFEKMEVDDSFFVPTEKDDKPRVATNVCSSSRTQKGKGKIFTTRIVEGGVRCWRIK